MKKVVCVMGVLGIIGLYAMGTSSAEITQEQVNSWIKEYIGFEKNYGQVSDFEGNPVNDVIFRAKLPGYGIFITKKGVSYVLYKAENSQTQNSITRKLDNPITQITRKRTNAKTQFSRFDIELLNCEIKENKIEYEDPLPGYTNYYLPQCPDGILGVITYREIRIKDVYPGIDWVWKYEDGKMHHQFEVKPGADLSKIKLKVKWADYKIKEDGKKIVFSTPIGKIEDGEILAYEAGADKSIDISYKKEEDGLISFDVKNYSGKNPLIIDPPLSLLWGTYYGGDTTDVGNSITTDASENVFVTGYSYSSDFPTQDPGGGAYFQGTNAGGSDAFILKFTNSGVRQWATYYGGNDDEWGNSITTDASGNVFVTGYTYSPNFPTYDPGGGAYYQGTNAGNQDAFILKFSNTGVRLWATYYGGSSYESGFSITTDGSGNVFVTGLTGSTDFPTYDPGGGAYYQDTLTGYCTAYILKFSNTGQRLWATYYGGNGVEGGNSITTDFSGNIFVTGHTWSTNFPTYDPGGGAYYQGTKAGGYDVFILKFSNAGQRLWATYYGGGSDESSKSITTDVSGNVFITGRTYSIDFPTYDPGGGAYYQGVIAGGCDAYILKFSNTGQRLWATYYGGGDYDYGYSITTDSSRNLFVTGRTSSVNFPTYDPGGAYYQDTLAGNCDAYILEFSNIGARLWATYYGGDGWDYGISISTDMSGNIFATGKSSSYNLPTFDPGGGAYYQGTNGGNYDAFILKFETSIGIEENVKPEVKEHVLLYSPTIFKDKISLKFAQSSKNPLSILLYNSSGSSVFEKRLDFTPFSLILDDKKIQKLSSGIYFLHVYSGKRNLGKFKLIKE